MTGSRGLVVDGVTLQFGAVRAIDDVSFTAEEGRIHGVIGPNGAGKSSLFNVISGAYRPTSGSVSFRGERLTGRAPDVIAAMGIGRSFQNIDLSGTETVLDSLLAGRDHLMRASVVESMFGLPRARREERRHASRVREIARFCGTDDVLDSPLHELPYGRRKVVDIVRAVCMEPRLLLLDEPAAGLDDSETEQIGQLVRELRDALDLTVLLIEHDMGLVMGSCDRITVLDFGRRIAEGTPAEIQGDPAVIAAYLGVGDTGGTDLEEVSS